MYCPNCGNKLNEKEIYCSSCGKKVGEDVISAFDYLSNSSIKSSSDASQKTTSKYLHSTLALGILSVIFSALNYLGLPFVHMIGIVLGIVALSLANSDKKVGRIYSIPGVITGIIGIVLGTVAFLFGFFSYLI